MMQGETVATGAPPPECDAFGQGCDERHEIGVCSSAAGYYVGYWTCEGPYSRESGYYRTAEEAADALASGVFGR